MKLILIASKSMLQNTKRKGSITYCSDDVCKMVLSNCTLRTMGVAEKQQRFLPNSFSFDARAQIKNIVIGISKKLLKKLTAHLM